VSSATDFLPSPEKTRRPAQARWRRAATFEQLGPGLITGAADDDPSGIATYSQAGAQFGYNMLWTMVLTSPLMSALQLVSGEIGRVTGCGLAKNLGDILPRWTVLMLVALLFLANTINIGANLLRWALPLSCRPARQPCHSRSALP
jgi:Mn2+/Fe2+ NRAMP family transporter